MRRALAVVVLAGCRQILGLDPIAAPVPVSDASRSGDLGTLLTIHFDGTQPATLDLGTQTVDAASDPRCDVRYRPRCVLVADDITISGLVTGVGAYGLTLAAWNDLIVDGGVDVSTHRGTGHNGAGANNMTCPDSQGLPAWSGGAGGGGAGGSFGGAGGKGGAGFGSGSAIGGTSIGSQTSINSPRGGCVGQNGTTADPTTVPAGGASGGAIYLLAGHQLTIHASAMVLACGEGGASRASSAGASGGGSGGLVALEAPSIIVDGTVLAEGGGGGGGGGSAVPGSVGQDGCAVPLEAATGGVAPTSGGPGGNGSVGGDGLGGSGGGSGSGSGGGGGGGGGGGTGWVSVSRPITGSGTISPAPR